MPTIIGPSIIVRAPNQRRSEFEAVRSVLAACGWDGPALPSLQVLWRTYVLVAQAQADDATGPIVGALRALSDGEGVVYISELAVLPDYRRWGVAGALLGQVRDDFPAARIDVLSSTAGKAFYEASGFSTRPGYRRWP